jgi:predicted CXXCH cytochrome family protein
MNLLHQKRKDFIFGTVLLFWALILFTAGAEAAQSGLKLGGGAQSGPKFAKKDCLDCHKKFADKYMGMKNVHAVVKEKNCEGCHLRHGIVPKLLLKKDGNEVCFPCHSKEKIGLNKSNVHTVLKRGKCVTCHDPHASSAAHLLKKEGNEACYEKKVIHKVQSEKGCTACHAVHSSNEKNLLVKAATPLCLGCHDSGKASFKKSHGGYPVEKAACTGCHNPHSSLKPKLLKASAHNPVSEGQCDSCHKPATAPKPFETTDDGSKLCANCHDSKERLSINPFRAACASPATIRILLRTRSC